MMFAKKELDMGRFRVNEVKFEVKSKAAQNNSTKMVRQIDASKCIISPPFVR